MEKLPTTLIVIALGAILGLMIIANIMPSISTASNSMNDSNRCTAQTGCTWNESWVVNAQCRNGSDAGVCAAGQPTKIPLGNNIWSIVMLIMLGGAGVWIFMHLMKKQ